MSWGALIRTMRNEPAPKAVSVTHFYGRTWVVDRSAWVEDWLSRTWGARNLTAAILGVR